MTPIPADHPSTRHMATRDGERRGVAAAQRLLCLAQVRHQAGLTAAEIAERVGLNRHVSSRRLPELRDAGLIVSGPVRCCSVTGRRNRIWNPTQETRS